jgi:hypothetical protein
MVAERARDAAQVRTRELAIPLLELAGNVSVQPQPYEWRITRQSDRIDISIESPRWDLLVFIENKIGASEQTDQIKRYLALLEQQRGFKKRLLILLAPEDYSPHSGVPGLQLSYQRDVRSWLNQSVPYIEAGSVQGLVKQYVDYVASWGSGTMPTAWESELMQLLGTKDHISATLEIGHVIGSLGTRLWSGFFDGAVRKIRDGFQPRGLEQWRIGWADQARKDPSKGVRCILRSEGRLQLAVGLTPHWGSENSELSLWGWNEYADLGIGFSKPNISSDIPEVAQLRSKLSEDGYLTDKNMDWWIGRRTKVFSIGDDFMIDCVNDIDKLTDRAASLVLDVLSRYSPEIEAADKALSPPQ